MNYEILEDGDLRIYLDRGDKACLRQMKMDLKRSNISFESDEAMYEIFEDLLAGTNLEWIQPEEIGALTSAPILGILDLTDPIEDGLGRFWAYVKNIKSAWGFMDYQLISPQEELLNQGYTIFQNGVVETKRSDTIRPDP